MAERRGAVGGKTLLVGSRDLNPKIDKRDPLW
jgi:hypothetical protein